VQKRKIKKQSKNKTHVWFYGTKYEWLERSVEIKRETGVIGLIILTYNLFHYEQLVRLNII